MTDKGTTAILFFSRTASEEAVSKTFSASLGTKGNRAISQRLIKKVLGTLNATGLTVIPHFSTVQAGNIFGERLANAVESVYDQGYERVIIVGNDCPFISTSLLRKVNIQLDTQALVLGPATDGGVYLIGINKNAYHRANFIDLHWQKVDLQASWKIYATDYNTEINWLEEYFDIDEEKDLRQLLSVLPHSSLLLRQLLQIIGSFQIRSKKRKITFSIKFCLFNHSLRGPPFYPAFGVINQSITPHF